jgi:cyclopropane-fatty-acyl-phospholipid synthase
MRQASAIRHGSILIEEPGGTQRVGGGTPAHRVTVRSGAFYTKVLARGEVGLGEAYVDGDWDCDNLPALLELGLRDPMLAEINGRTSAVARLLARRRHRGRANTLERSPANVQDHFDAGNRLFELMLGPSMLYTCAFFEDGSSDLAAAEAKKYERVARALNVHAGSHVLDLGCGFGGLAIYLAGGQGCRVTGISLSPAQLEVADKRVREAGLADRVSLEYRDYREVRGSFDALAVIGMLENVGQEFLHGCMAKCSELLRPGGRMVVDVMTTPDRTYRAGREGDSWLQRYIFPGGSTPSLGALANALSGTRLMMVEARDTSSDYAATCRAWRRNFESHETEIGALGFDERFIRTWRYWLSIGEAAFSARKLSSVLAVYERLPGS